MAVGADVEPGFLLGLGDVFGWVEEVNDGHGQFSLKIIPPISFIFLSRYPSGNEEKRQEDE